MNTDLRTPISRTTVWRAAPQVVAAILAVWLYLAQPHAVLAQQQAGQSPQWTRSDMAALMGEMAQRRREDEAGVRHSKWTDTGTYVRSANGTILAVRTSQHGLITVRVAGVDVPEQDLRFAENSIRFLRSFARGATLKLDCHTIDRFGQHVCEVRKGNQDLGASLVGAGLAWHRKRYGHEQSPANRELYAKLETEARSKRLGLWADIDATQPEACRHFKSSRLGCE
jgi:endonuclease YncB( thermonuclease family)